MSVRVLCKICFLSKKYVIYVTVIEGQLRECHESRQLTVTAPSGYISNTVGENKGFGFRCPWIIKVHKAQKINISLLYFQYKFPRIDQSEGEAQRGSFCRRLAIIRENGKQTSICGGNLRERNVYISEGNELQVEIVRGRSDEDLPSFLLHYQGQGL